MAKRTGKSDSGSLELKERLEGEILALKDLLPRVNEEFAAIYTAQEIFEKEAERPRHLLQKDKIGGVAKVKFATERLEVYHDLLALQIEEEGRQKLLSQLEEASLKARAIREKFMQLKENGIREARQLILAGADAPPLRRKEHLPKEIRLNPSLPAFSNKHLNYPYKFHLRCLRNASLPKSFLPLLKALLSELNEQSFGAGKNNAVKVSKEVSKKFKLKSILSPYSPQKEVRKVEKEIRRQRKNTFVWQRECLREHKNLCILSANVQREIQLYHRKKLVEMIELIEDSPLAIQGK